MSGSEVQLRQGWTGWYSVSGTQGTGVCTEGTGESFKEKTNTADHGGGVRPPFYNDTIYENAIMVQ